MINKRAKFKPLNPGQWVAVKTIKTQIVLHHTAGGHSVSGVVAWWNSNKERVATAYLVNNKGGTYQCFDDSDYAFSLYVSAPSNKVVRHHKDNDLALNRGNIGIELTNAGWLTRTPKGFKPSFPIKGYFAPENVAEVSFRDQEYFEVYYPAQIKATCDLLTDLLDEHKIIRDGFIRQDLDFIFDISEDALQGKPGVYTHCSYRTDKTDVYPHPGLIMALKELQKKYIDRWNVGNNEP